MKSPTLIQLFLLITGIVLCTDLKAQTGYFKTSKDFDNHNIVEFEEVSFVSSAFGCNVNFWKNDKKQERLDQHDIFGFVDKGAYYRFYKYAIIHVLVRGEISFFGLVPTTLSFDEKEKVFTIRGTDKMLLFVSDGPSGELKRLSKKNLLELVANDEEVFNLYKSREIDHLNCILLYNVKHPAPDAFVMNNKEQMTLDELSSYIDED